MIYRKKACGLQITPSSKKTLATNFHAMPFYSYALFMLFQAIFKLFCNQALLFRDLKKRTDRLTNMFFSFMHIVWKLLKMSHLNFGISNNFCPIKTDLPGNTVWPQASGFEKVAKMDHFWHFELIFVHSKCKRSSLRSLNVEWDFFCDFQTPCFQCKILLL